jgi:hypothetical protein
MIVHIIYLFIFYHSYKILTGNKLVLSQKIHGASWIRAKRNIHLYIKMVAQVDQVTCRHILVN